MKRYEVYKSEGGFRVAAELVNGCPVISRGLGKKLFKTFKAASCAAMNAWSRDDEAEAFVVSNTYGISGTSRHMTAEAALRERNRREGRGWIVEDGEGNRLDMHDGNVVIW